MEPPVESRLLRLAMAKGLLEWKDLEAVADRVTVQDSDVPGELLWMQALVESGRLSHGEVAALLSELEAGETPPPTLVEAPPGRAGAVAFPPELRFLKDWPRYRVERFLGSGGMGSVYLAFDPQLDRHVALKFLHHNDPALMLRFQREARAQARVEHPNLCQVHEVGEVEGRPYIAMQFIEGKSLSELRTRLSIEDAVRLVRDVARAVHAAHRTGLIHRDLKPANILVGRDDTGALHPCVVDFGLAQDQGDAGLTRTGMITGTPAYVSPEQVQEKGLDRRSDVYSLGVMLYELLTGAPPFVGPNAAATLLRVLQEEPEPPRRHRPSVSADLETIVLKCLEKDPGRRYDSARDLAEDLDRCLEGDPIAARPAGWAYRAGKRLRKHRALAAVAALAVLGLAAMGVEVLRTRWQAQERAELARRFGQRVENLEANLRIEAFLPRHDVTAAKGRLRRELDTIGDEMRRLGPIAEGPGHYALGQGYLALHQDELAREHLERAWQSGERGPEVAAALGRAFASVLEAILANPGLAGTLDQDQLRQRFRTPALSYLKEGAKSQRSPYLLALIAFYEERYPEAVARAREAYREAPSLYEAGELEARIYRTRADDALEADRRQEALRLYDRSGEIYGRLLAVVPSDAALYGGECLRRSHRLAALADISDESVREALQPCRTALQVDPGLSQVHTFMAGIHWSLGDRKLRHGQDPRADLSASLAEARRAIASNPRDARAFTHLSIASRLLATWRLGRGEDPGADLRRSIQAAEEAVRLQPELAANHNSLTLISMVVAADQQRRGVDPRPILLKAVASAHRALDLNPGYLASRINLGQAWNQIAEAESARGLDPSRSLEAAVEAFRQAVALNPEAQATHNNLGNTYLTFGEYLLARGDDPRPMLQKAVASYRRTLELKPDYIYGPYNLAYTYRLLAQAAFDHGADPSPSLATARTWLEASSRLNPNDSDTFLEQARVELIAARSGKDAGFSAAQAALTRAGSLNPEDPKIHLEQAILERWQAEAAIARGAPGEHPEAGIRRGLEEAGQALQVNAKDALALAVRGALLHLQAALETDAIRRAELSDQAGAALRAAFVLNPLLRREYGALVGKP